ncbi:MAG: hypothetical protein K9N07_08280 [Candidatus Cloacimonetes bacterium]|nr:hypothetical protein [Candidatus Cloacimonadota bacterium]
MGYQQILMLVLGVIIIGLSAAVGLSMFTNEMKKINRQSIISDMNIFAGVANAYYKAPSNLGGGNREWDVDNLGMWFGYNYNDENNSISNDNGVYIFSASGDLLTIIGTGTSVGNNGSTNVRATLQLNGQTSEIITQINN